MVSTDAIYLLERRNVLADELGADRFVPLGKYLLGPSVIAWSARNAGEVEHVLAVRHMPTDGIARLTSLQEDFLFHFRNYVSALAGARDYLFEWASESRVEEIDAYALEFKKSPAVQIINALRSRLLHGAHVFSSFGSYLSLGGPKRGKNRFATQLYPGALDALKDLPRTVQPLVAAIEAALGERDDWMTPLVIGSQAELERAWRRSEEAFYDRYGALVDERRAQLETISDLEDELDEFRRAGPVLARRIERKG